MTGPATRATIVGLLLVVAMTGCGDASESAASAAAGIQQNCSTDDECGTEMACHQGWNACTVVEGPAQTVAIVAEPPSKEAYVASHESNVLVQPGQSDINVVLPRAVTITGQVRIKGNGLDTGVQASILAVANEAAIGGEFRTAKAIADKEYSMLLQADTTYTVRIRVDDTDWPAFVTEVTFSDDQEYVFWLPEPSTYPELSGVIKRTSDGTTPLPLRDLLVTARDIDTGYQCTSATTGMLGDYTLKCPDPGTYAIRVSPTADSEVPIPAFDVVLNGAKAFRLDDGGRQMDPIIIGEQARQVELTVTVMLGDTPQAQLPVRAWTQLDTDPRVAAEWKDTASGAILVREGLTDDDGQVSFQLLDGTYTVTVAPHSSSEWASQTRVVTVSDTQDEVFQVYPKPELTGQVRSYASQPVGGAAIEAERVVVDPATGTSTRTTFRTTAENDGSFTLPVDAGELTLTVVPPPGSAQPRWTHTLDIEASQSLDVVLARPTLVEGLVLAPDRNAGVEGVDLQVYGIGDGGQTTLLGRGTSFTDGRYVIVLPSP